MHLLSLPQNLAWEVLDYPMLQMREPTKVILQVSGHTELPSGAMFSILPLTCSPSILSSQAASQISLPLCYYPKCLIL